jgi:TPR repeat protein
LDSGFGTGLAGLVAALNLGDFYEEARDYAKAREWYEKAAEGGDARAMFFLGWLYYLGRGVARD